MTEDKLSVLKRLLDSARSAIASAEEVLSDIAGGDLTIHADYGTEAKRVGAVSDGGKVIEGVFNGERMVGPDGKEYPVPANYASKSKLVPGDVLKLTIHDDGKLLYKQIGPIPRKTVIGTLVRDGNKFGVMTESKTYSVLLASVTYYKASLGDQISLIIPEVGDSEWGAIEAVLPKM